MRGNVLNQLDNSNFFNISCILWYLNNKDYLFINKTGVSSPLNVNQ